MACLVAACVLTVLVVLYRLYPVTFQSLEGLRRAFLMGPDEAVLPGRGRDLWGTLWTFDFARRLLAGEVGVVNPEVFAPVGWDQGAAQGYAWLDAILAWPLVWLLGPVRFYGVYVALLVAANLLAFVHLFRKAGAPFSVSVGLAMIVAHSAFVLHELSEGRTTQAHLVFHALFLGQVLDLHAGRGPPWRKGLTAGVFLAAACYVYWFTAIAVGAMAALATFAALVVRRSPRRPLLLGGAALTTTTLVLALVPTWRLSKVALAGGYVEAWFEGATARTFTVLGFLPVETRSALDWTLAAPMDFPGALIWHGVPRSLLLLAAGSLLALWRWRRHGPWLVAALAAWTLPMGPEVIVGDDLVRLPTLFLVLEDLLPVMSRCDQVDRLVVAPMLGLALSVALASAALGDREHRAARVAGVALGLTCCAWSLLPQVRVDAVGSHIHPDRFLLEVARRWPGGMIDVPIEEGEVRYWQQLFHRQPVFSGPETEAHVRPADHHAYAASNEVLVFLHAAAKGATGPDPDWGAALARLVSDGFSVLVVHPTSRLPGEDIAARLGLPALAMDGRIYIPLEPTERDWNEARSSVHAVRKKPGRDQGPRTPPPSRDGPPPDRGRSPRIR